MPRNTAPGDASDTAPAEGETPRAKRSTRAKVAAPVVTKGVGWVVATGGGLTTLLGVVNDVLVPHGWLAGIVLALALGALGVTFLPKVRFPKVHHTARKYLKGYWGKPLRAALVVSAGLSGAAFAVSASAPVGGVIGANLPAIHDWQVQLGIVAANTTRIAEDLTAIKDELQNVKQETSGDPRKELANLGVAWTTEAFVQALKLGDERTVGLFLDGGMLPTAMHKNASAVVYILQPGLTESSVPMLTLLLDKGFDLDTILTDDYIMSDATDPTRPFSAFPPPFENQDPPLQLGYGHFEGPALLWVVMMATWYGPTDHDVETINFLLQHGADRHVAMNYMTATGTWNDTPPYTQVLEMLKS